MPDHPDRQLVDWLTDHCERLLRVDGRRSDDLVRLAYPNPADLEAAWDALETLRGRNTGLEAAFDDVVSTYIREGVDRRLSL